MCWWDVKPYSINHLPRCMECWRGLTMRILSVRPSVCPSVRLSYACIVTKRKKDMFTFYTPYERSFILVFFWEKEWLVGATASTWNFGSTGPRWSEIADFESIIARSASAVGLRPSEKSSINIKVRISDSEAQNYAQKFTKNIIIHETPFRLTHHL